MYRQEELLTKGGTGGGDGKAEGWSATEDGGQAASSLMPYVDGTHIRVIESSKLEGSHVGIYCSVQINCLS